MVLRFQPGFEVAKFSGLKYDGMTVETRFDGVPLADSRTSATCSSPVPSGIPVRIVVPRRDAPVNTPDQRRKEPANITSA